MQYTIGLGQALIVIRLLLWILGFKSPITNMMLQNQIDQAIVSVWLNKASEQDAKLSKGGQFIFGGVDPSLYTGSITYLPVTSDSQWQVAVDGVYIGRKELAVSKSSSYAVVDTGSSYILFPDYLATAFHRAIPNSQYDKDLGWMIPCTLAKSTSVGDLTFVLGGQKFAVPLSDIVILESGFKGICLSAIDSWSEATNGHSGESVSTSAPLDFELLRRIFFLIVKCLITALSLCLMWIANPAGGPIYQEPLCRIRLYGSADWICTKGARGPRRNRTQRSKLRALCITDSGGALGKNGVDDGCGHGCDVVVVASLSFVAESTLYILLCITSPYMYHPLFHSKLACTVLSTNHSILPSLINSLSTCHLST